MVFLFASVNGGFYEEFLASTQGGSVGFPCNCVAVSE